MKRCISRCLALFALTALAACQSVSLIDANKEFVALVHQGNEAKKMHESGRLDKENYDLTMDAIRTSHNENGKEQEAAAARASNTKNEVSFLNVAARNYLQSGSKGAQKVPGIAADGWTKCQTGNPAVLSELPSTCAYFLIATPQTVQNEQVRSLEILIGRVQSANVPGGASVEDAKALENAVLIVIEQLNTLEALHDSSVLADTSSGFRRAVYRQQHAMVCTAEDALAQKIYLPEQGDGWDKAKAVADMTNKVGAARSKLSERTGGSFPTC